VVQVEPDKQVALAEAHAEHRAALEDVRAKHSRRIQSAQAWFDAVKHDPTHPGRNPARKELGRAIGAALDTKAIDTALDEAIRIIERKYRAQLDRLGEAPTGIGR
jgi:hypothetical protein